MTRAEQMHYANVAKISESLKVQNDILREIATSLEKIANPIYYGTQIKPSDPV